MASKRNTRHSTIKKDIVKETVIEVESICDDDVKKVIFGVNLSTEEALGSKSTRKKKALTESTNKSVQRRPKSTRTVKAETESDSIKSDDDHFSDDEDWLVNEDFEKPSGICGEDDVAGGEICSFRTPKKRNGMIHKAVESAKKNSELGTPKNKTQSPAKALTPAKTPKRGRSSSAVKIAFSPAKVLTPTKTPKRGQPPSALKKNLVNQSTPKRDGVTPRKRQEEIELKSKVAPMTPYPLRERRKKAIQTYRRELEAEDSEDGDSCYNDSDQSWKSDSEEESEANKSPSSGEDSASDSGKGSEDAPSTCRRSLRFPLQHATTAKTKKQGDINNYVFTADEYFQTHSSKCMTSDHRLSRLSTPRLDSASLHSLLAHCSATPQHKQALAARRANDNNLFQRWMFALSQGFSVLLYGLGSKYSILQNFQCQMLQDSRVLVVNGFFPALNIKELVESLAKDLLGLKQTLPTANAVLEWIESRTRAPRVFLLIHNLDAEPLRCEKTQLVLSRLAALPRIHLLASVDHINCPLLWDQAKLSSFNFMWEDVTSYLPYREETSYETSLMVHNSGSLALSSLLSVYRSLTHNSRGVFRIILEKHLDENNPKYQGMPFSTLYSRCREEMLVTSDLALRTMLTEFLDHQMVKWRRDNEHLYIPTDTAILRQFHKII